MGRNHPKDLTNETEYPSKVGGKRCKRIRRDGVRCKNWAAPGFDVCCFHGVGRKGSPQRMKYQFRDKQLGKTFAELKADPDRLDLTEELALTRLCLASITAKTDKMTSGSISSIICLAADVTKVANVMSRIERDMKSSVSVEQVAAIADQFLQVIIKHIKDEDTLMLIQEDLDRVVLPNAN